MLPFYWCVRLAIAKCRFHAPGINTYLRGMYITWNLWSHLHTWNNNARGVLRFLAARSRYEIIITFGQLSKKLNRASHLAVLLKVYKQKVCERELHHRNKFTITNQGESKVIKSHTTRDDLLSITDTPLWSEFILDSKVFSFFNANHIRVYFLTLYQAKPQCWNRISSLIR